MKRKIIFMALAATIGLSACSQNKSGKTPTETKQNNQKQVKEKKMKVTELTAEIFKKQVMDYEKHPNEWVFAGERPAVIDFYATWCGPCKATAPVIDELAGVYDGKVDFYKVDVDKQQELAALFGVRSIPSLLFVPKTGKPSMQVGAMNRQQLEDAIKNTLLK